VFIFIPSSAVLLLSVSTQFRNTFYHYFIDVEFPLFRNDIPQNSIQICIIFLSCIILLLISPRLNVVSRYLHSIQVLTSLLFSIARFSASTAMHKYLIFWIFVVSLYLSYSSISFLNMYIIVSLSFYIII